MYLRGYLKNCLAVTMTLAKGREQRHDGESSVFGISDSLRTPAHAVCVVFVASELVFCGLGPVLRKLQSLEALAVLAVRYGAGLQAQICY